MLRAGRILSIAFLMAIGVAAAIAQVRIIDAKWGSCPPGARSICPNTDLAKKPQECLEYIVVHEMAHLLEPTHIRDFSHRVLSATA